MATRWNCWIAGNWRGGAGEGPAMGRHPPAALLEDLAVRFIVTLPATELE